MGEKMKDILIIAHFAQVPGEKGNGRFNYIANMLVQRGYDVEMVTTRFSHRNKSNRIVKEKELEQLGFKLTMLDEGGYQKNVSLKRFYSHHTFGKNLRDYLKSRRTPDIIYCAVPSLDAGYIAARYAKEKNVKFVIDIQDVWPEAFKMVFNIPVISDLIFYPMRRKADYIYNMADEVIAVSETYKNRALSSNSRINKGLSVFLGTELDTFDKLAEQDKFDKPSNEIWLAYIGTLGHSYDLNCVIDAIYLLEKKGIKNIKFIVMGDGPLKSKFINYANSKGINSAFTGRLEYSEMVKILTACDIAVNPISKGTAASIINKVGDYAAASLPVLNTQECREYMDLITNYNAGLNCENGNPHDLAEKILSLYYDDNLRVTLGSNNRRMADDKFDRKKTYTNIITTMLGE
ncbi:TPA: glycosyltransferase family 4 protein [Bacillus paranthracis]